MVRRNNHFPLHPPSHEPATPDQMRRGATRLQLRIDELEALSPNEVTQIELEAIECAIGETLESVFEGDDGAISRYARARVLLDPMELYTSYGLIPFGHVRDKVAEGRDRSLSLLKQAARGLRERAELDDAEMTNIIPHNSINLKYARKVFIVHGHDEGAREMLATFLRKSDFEPIILHERANQGRTIIEKVVAHSDVGFAVVLLTPDDIGSAKGESPRSRARQNVLLELGYFVGKLGRENVCAMKRGDLELPSDWQGVVNTEFDSHGGWRQMLARELQAAGHEIDWRKALS